MAQVAELLGLTVMKLLQERTDWKLPLIACLQLSEEFNDGIFWGRSVRNRAQCADNRSLSRLRALSILRLESKSGNSGTASYRVSDPKGLRQALIDLGIDADARLPGDWYNLAKRHAT